MNMPTMDHRYEAYVDWCAKLGMPPAPFDIWRRELTIISEMPLPDGKERTRVLLSAK